MYGLGLSGLVLAQPANDSFATPTILVGVPATVAGSNSSATLELDEPLPDSYAEASVWFEWEAPLSGAVQIDTIGSNFDTWLAVWTGTEVANLTLLADNDDYIGGGGDLVSAVFLNVIAGTTYRIAVYGNESSSGDITLNISEDLTSKISGTVTGPDGTTPLQGIYASVYRWNDTIAYWEWMGWAETDANGEYTIGGLHAGTYRAEFNDWNGDYVTEVYDGASDLNSGTDILVPAEMTVTGIDASLDSIADSAPHFLVNPNSNVIIGESWLVTLPWLPNTEITIIIADPENPDHIEYRVMSDAYGYWTAWDLNEYDIQAGDVITISDGATTVAHEVRDLGVEGVDASTDEVWGWAAAYSWIGVWIDNTGVGRSVQADAEGRWIADFSVPVGDGQNENRTFDIQTEDTGWALQDHDGQRPPGSPLDTFYGSTTADWHVRQAVFEVNLTNNRVWGQGWPSGEQVNIAIGYDLLHPEYTGMVTVEENGTWTLNQVSFIIVPGMQVRAQCGGLTKEHEVRDLGMPLIDADTDTVHGTASPGTWVIVYIYYIDGYNIWRNVLADANGEWIADFSVAVGDAPGDQTSDIVEGTEGDASFRDEDGDATYMNWLNSKYGTEVFMGLFEMDGDGPDHPPTKFRFEFSVKGSPIVAARFRTPLNVWHDLVMDPNDWWYKWDYAAEEPTYDDLNARFPAGEYLVEITNSSGVSTTTHMLPESMERPNAVPNILTPLNGAVGVGWPETILEWAPAVNPNFNFIVVEIRDEVGTYEVDEHFGDNFRTVFPIAELEPDSRYEVVVAFSNHLDKVTGEGLYFELVRARLMMSSFTTVLEPPPEMRARIDWYLDHEVTLDLGDTWSKAENRDRFDKGLTLRQEHVADTIPNDPDSTFRVNILNFSNPLAISFDPSSPLRVYTLQYRTNLTEGEWGDVENQTRIPGGTPLEGSAYERTGFYRVIVELP